MAKNRWLSLRPHFGEAVARDGVFEVLVHGRGLGVRASDGGAGDGRPRDRRDATALGVLPAPERLRGVILRPMNASATAGPAPSWVLDPGVRTEPASLDGIGPSSADGGPARRRAPARSGPSR